MNIQQKLLAAFDSEHREHLAKLRGFMDLWFGENAEAALQGTIAEAFRSAHSLKGASRVVDLKTVMEVAHRLESLFALFQTKKRQLRPEYEPILRQSFDIIEDTVAASREEKPLPEIHDILVAIQAAIDDQPLPAAKSAPVSSPVPVSHPVPNPVPEIRPMEKAEPIVVARSIEKPGATGFDTMRLSSEHFDRLMKTTGEVINFSRNQEEKAGQLRDIAQTLRLIEKEWALVQKHSIKYLKSMTKDPELMRVAKYLTFVESETRALSRRLRNVSLDQKNANLSLRILGEQLQEDVQTARLIPASDVFEGFSKMMRDLAKDEGKDCDFRMIGMDKEADRVVLQALKDPLMHILRNALSHGIERADERARLNKSLTGRITMKLEVISRQLHITISDDGRGLDLEKIRKTAVECRLVDAEIAASLGPSELQSFIFHANFSTAREITEVSGRGVGLSVVKEALLKLQGDVAIDSLPSQGCRFMIHVPLRLSTSRLMLLECQGQTLAIPTHSVQSVHRVKKSELATIEGRAVIRVQDAFVEIRSLSQLLDMTDATVRAHEDNVSFCIVKNADKRLAVAVDAFLGEREGLIKELGAPLHNAKRYSGGVLLDRSRIALVINPNALFEGQKRSQGGSSLEVARKAEAAARLRILVVDDSFTTRILEKSILEAMGYRVDVATDGLEALTFLQTNDVDLIISDVEMPRMDGLTLLQNVRSHSRLKNVPVIMVSSRNEREDQERGLNLGADAYLPKQEFSQQTLLETIRQVL